MLKIRLQRVGRKHETAYRLVLTDSKNSTKSGRLKEVLGSYDPRKLTDLIKAERVKYWLEKGAQASGTAHNLLVTHKVINVEKINVLPKKTPIVKEAPAAEAPAEAPVAETAAPEAAPEEVVAEAPAAEVTPETPAEPVVESTEAEA
jgi:small subunit ribosomal protein S16